jgi:hypothetical protein
MLIDVKPHTMQNPGDFRLPEDFQPRDSVNVRILSDGDILDNHLDDLQTVLLSGTPFSQEDETAARKETTLYE